MFQLRCFFILVCAVFAAHAQDPDPAIFQTWYLYSQDGDLGETQYYYGEDVPQITINNDFSYTATDNCWDISGNFNYLEGDTTFPFYLENVGFEEACVLGGNTNRTLSVYFQYPEPLASYMNEGTYTELHLLLTFKPGFGLTFRNQITLSVADNHLEQIVVFPNPACESISISGVSAPIDAVRILNNAGCVVQEFTAAGLSNLDVSQLATGLYFLSITSEGTTTIRKFLKQ